jgi:sugar phosphate isomerase/epimerase
MKLSLSVRIAETAAKDRLTVSFEHLARLALHCGYHAVCLRPSVVGANTPADGRRVVRTTLDHLNLPVSMATTDIAVPLNNEHGPDMLRDIEPHLNVAQQFGTGLIRVCMKCEDDISWAQRAADQARERGIRLAHQCHTDSLFETVSGALDVIARVARANFGIIYEAANLMLCGEDYGPDSVRRLAPHIMNVYVQNHRMSEAGKSSLPTRVRGVVRFDATPLWDPSGGVDFTDVFRALADVKYDGYVTVHQAYAELMGPDAAAQKSAEFLRGVGHFDPGNQHLYGNQP